MRRLVFLCCLLFASSLAAQTPAAPARPELLQAMVGTWVGVLEYRDYSEPPTSTKRVQLPTWLTVSATADGLARHFTYDDGPTKTVEDSDSVTLDPAALTYSETDPGKPAQVQQISGYAALKAGRGTLILTGTGTDNGKPTETRTTLLVGRNILTWTLEVRPAASSEPFSFRHRFTFTRAEPPHLPAK